MRLKNILKRWAFKHPDPADFFRTMEDASAIDLDWFWRGGFIQQTMLMLLLKMLNGFKWKKTTRKF